MLVAETEYMNRPPFSIHLQRVLYKGNWNKNMGANVKMILYRLKKEQ